MKQSLTIISPQENPFQVQDSDYTSQSNCLIPSLVSPSFQFNHEHSLLPHTSSVPSLHDSWSPFGWKLMVSMPLLSPKPSKQICIDISLQPRTNNASNVPSFHKGPYPLNYMNVVFIFYDCRFFSDQLQQNNSKSINFTILN